MNYVLADRWTGHFLRGSYLLDFRTVREKVTQRLGEKRYKAGYSLLAVAGFILIAIGVSKAEPVSLWNLPNGDVTL